MRLLLATALIATLFAPSAFGGSDQAQPGLSGVWTGRIGNLPITVCFNNDEWGSYYYRRHRVPIELRPQDDAADKTATVLQEANGTWRIDSVSSKYLGGTWASTDKSRELPIGLTRVELLAEDLDGGTTPCGSNAYNQAIESSIATYAGSVQSIGDIQYRIITTAFPGEKGGDFKGRQLYMETIKLVGDSPSIKAINMSLGEKISGSEDDLLVCRQHAMNEAAREGYRSQDILVSVVSHWFIVDVRNHSFCGDRIGSWQSTHMWNLVTGEPDSPLYWFESADATADDEGRYQPEGTLPAALDLFISRRFGQGNPSNHLSREELEQCYGEYAPGAYSYQIKLADDGIDFEIPATSYGTCGDSFKLTFQELEPYLNQEGLQAIAAIKASKNKSLR